MTQVITETAMKKIATKKVVVLYPINTLNGVERYNEIFSDEKYKLSKIYQFVRFPMLEETIREDGCYKTGMTLYGWFVFEKGYEGDIILKQINNNKYCVGSKCWKKMSVML